MEFPLDEIEERKKKEEYFKKIGSVRFRYGWQLIEA
jgi:hypothetical protein